MLYLVNYSGGSGSTVAMARAVERYGKQQVRAVFADTNSEHPSLYRLLEATEQRLGVPIVRLDNGGRDVWDVFDQQRMIKVPRGGCKASTVLKHEQLDRYRAANFDPATTRVILGLDWSEPKRRERAVASLAGWTLEFPLCWPKQLTKDEELQELVRLGLPIPDLYRRGHGHNNCGGACILGGISHWVGLLQDDPERFLRYAERERAWRATTGSDFSILKDRRGGKTRSLTLFDLKTRVDAGEVFRPWREAYSVCG